MTRVLRKKTVIGPFVSVLWVYNKFIVVNSKLQKRGGFKACFQQSTEKAHFAGTTGVASIEHNIAQSAMSVE